MSKKCKVLICAILAMVSLLCLFTACKSVNVTITFVVDGNVYGTINTSGNEVVSIPESPTKTGYTFDGWYWDEGTWQRPFTANSLLNEPLTADMSVYAKFSKIHMHNLIMHNAVDASCEHAGNSAYYTCECGKIFADEQGNTELSAIPTIGKTEHTPSEWIIDKTATCTENGAKHIECSVCHTTLQTETIPATGHKYSQMWSRNDEYHWYQATCGHDLKQDYGKHSLTNGVCSVCNYNQHANEVEVKVYIDGTYQQSVYTDSSKNFIIVAPEKPEDITTNTNAERYFYGWFVDPNYQTPLFDTTTFENGGAIYGKWYSVYFSQFAYSVSNGKATITATTLSNSTTVVVVPAYINSFPVVKISPSVFYGKTMLRTVILCNGIEELGANVFANCNSMEEIHIPQSVNKIGNNAFQGCNLLSSVRMEDLSAWKEIDFGDAYSDPTYNGAQLYENNKPVYKLTYNLNGGMLTTDNEVYYKADSSFALNEPTKTDYEFTGWTYDEITTPVKNLRIENMTGNKTIVANWKYIKFNISYNLDGGVNDVKNPTTYSKLGDDVQIFEPQKRGYEFLGWTGNKWQSPTKNVIIASGSEDDVSLTAHWQIITYDITYDLNGGVYDGAKVEQYDVMDNIALFNPTRDYYTFSGWTGTDLTTATQNVTISNAIGDRTYTANWTPISYSITYDLDGGNHSNPTSYTVESRITLDSPFKTGYTFVGWTGSGLEVPTINVSFSFEHENKIFIAHWSLNTYTITYNLNGGQTPSDNPLTYTYLDSITLAQPTKDYYTFAGWTGTGLSTAKTSVTLNKSTGDKTFTATWTPIEYSITYNLDGGINNASNPSQYSVESNTITLAEPTKEGYTFMGWYVDDIKITEIASGSHGNITLTAKWAQYVLSINQTTGGAINVGITEHTVSFDSNASNVTAPQAQVVTPTVGLKYPAIPTRSGYVFAGWYDNASCNGVPYDFTKTVGNDITLYAKWIAYSGQGVLNLNKSMSVSCYSRNSSTYRYYAFVPLVSGEITIYTTGNADTYGFLYNSAKNLLVSNDDSGSGYNFSITYNVSAGTLYYIRPCGYNSNVSTTLNISAMLPNDGGKVDNYVQNDGGVTAGKTIELFVRSTHEAYDWLGWYQGDTLITNEQNYQFVMPNESVEITAKWQPKTYTITYEGTRNVANSNPVSYTIEMETFALQKIAYNGYSFLGWKQGNETVGEIAKGTYGDITLTASWILYKLNDIEYDTSKNVVSVNDIIDGKLFNVRCLDTDGNYATITTEYNGQLVAGSSITIMFTAELNGKSKALTLNNVNVYGEPTLTYDDSVNYINIDDELTAAWFGASSVDMLGNPVAVSAEIVGEYKAGDVISVVLSATDVAGNTVTATLDSVRVYGKPTITFDDTVTNVKSTDELTTEYFKATAQDSFGEQLTVECSYGNFVAGKIAAVTFTATDSKGNMQTVTAEVKVYSMPTFLDVVKTDYSITDIVTVDNLGVIATDTYGENLDITITITEGEWLAGNVATYTLTAADVAGNVITKNISIKVYDKPTITIGITDIKSTDSIVPATFNAVALDSFGEEVTLTITYISGELEQSAVRVYNFSATDASGNVTEITKDIKVYFAKDINLSYERFGDAMIKKTSCGEEFFATATDGFGDPCKMSVEPANGQLLGGQIVDLYIVATDNAGNSIRSDKITDIKVYDTPMAVLQQQVVYTDTNFRFLYFVYDSFGGQLAANITVQGELIVGNTVNVRVVATDDVGNTLDVTYQHVISHKDFVLASVNGLLTLTAYTGNDTTDFVIPEYVQAIGDNAFANVDLNSITLHEDITYVGNNAFANCNAQFVTPQKTGYYFVFVDEQNEVVDIRRDSGNVQSQFRLNIYSINYDLNGGINNISNPSTYTIESEAIVLAEPTKDYYIFAGWSDNGTIASGSYGDKTFVASWTPIEYAITYELNGGTNDSSNPTVYTIESEDIALFSPTKTGYTFTGWSDGGTIPQGSVGNKTFIASWEIIEYSITYELNGGTNSGDNPSTYTVESEDITLSLPTKFGYDFVGWSDGGTIPQGSVGNKTFIASWQIIEYSITYELNGGTNSGDNPTTYTVESEDIILVAPTKAGYTFTGWSDGGKVAGGSIGNKVFTASWKANVNMLLFDGNGSVRGEIDSRSVSTDETITLPSNKYQRDDAYFIGWAFSSDGEVAYTDCGEFTMGTDSEVTLYAVWKLLDVTLEFVDSTHSTYSVSGLRDQTIENVVIPNSFNGVDVVEIKGSAFRNCTSIKSISIPDSIATIGFSAFDGCSILTSVTMGKGVKSVGFYAFRNCSVLISVNYTGNILSWCNVSFDGYYANPLYYAHNLYINNELVTDLVMPDTITEIKSYAFYGCTSITSVTIPYSVISIGEFAFYYCSGLTRVDYTGDIESWCKINIGYYANPLSYAHSLYINNELVSEIVVPNTITEIKSDLFRGCSNITSVTIPDSVTSIGDRAFYECGGLTSITIPDSVTSIGSSSFYECSSLTSVTIGNSVTSIGKNAFEHCDSLTNIAIPNSVKSMGALAFMCMNLKEVYYTGTVESWCKIEFDSFGAFWYSYDLYINNELLVDLIIPDSITSIGMCFVSCKSIRTVTMSDNVLSIDGSFDGCRSLTDVKLSKNIKTIGDYSFRWCVINSITISNSITSIGNDVFYGSMRTIYYNGTIDEWAKISIGSNNDILNNASRYYYSETEPALNSDGTAYDGNYWHYNGNNEIVVWTYKKENN